MVSITGAVLLAAGVGVSPIGDLALAARKPEAFLRSVAWMHRSAHGTKGKLIVCHRYNSGVVCIRDRRRAVGSLIEDSQGAAVVKANSV